MKVAVITEVPAPATVAVVPFNEITDVVAEEKVQVPGVDGVGATKSNAAAP